MGDLLNEVYTFKRPHTFTEVILAIRDYPWGDVVRRETLADGSYLMKFYTAAILGDGIEGYRRYTTGYQVIYSMKENKMSISMEYAFNLSHSRISHAKVMMNLIFRFLDEFDMENGKDQHPDDGVIDAEILNPQDSSAVDAEKLLSAKRLLDAGAISLEEYQKIKDFYLRQFR